MTKKHDAFDFFSVATVGFVAGLLVTLTAVTCADYRARFNRVEQEVKNHNSSIDFLIDQHNESERLRALEQES